ncbi:hypothetical protein BOSEA1005_10179 [Hyphomicrobiales bacterium]|nr:hypothetical protein BOSEA1005_10179 [Hyphomicrobiales bacterium]CAI0342710.1 hypothetical protein BO1005MUT1_10003 [Hyphomicrobiales bacterium]
MLPPGLTFGAYILRLSTVVALGRILHARFPLRRAYAILSGGGISYERPAECPVGRRAGAAENAHSEIPARAEA